MRSFAICGRDFLAFMSRSCPMLVRAAVYAYLVLLALSLFLQQPLTLAIEP